MGRASAGELDVGEPHGTAVSEREVMAARRLPRPGEADVGTGIISAVFGIAIFLVFVLFASQVLLNLYTRSVVTSAATRGAEIVAAANGGPTAEPVADATVERLLGQEASRATLTWQVTSTEVALTVRLTSPSLLPVALGGPLGLERITRTVVLAREALP